MPRELKSILLETEWVLKYKEVKKQQPTMSRKVFQLLHYNLDYESC